MYAVAYVAFLSKEDHKSLLFETGVFSTTCLLTYIVGHLHGRLVHPAARRMLRWAELVAREGKKNRC